MAEKGNTIEKLYVSIGLNADDLKVGFEQTDKTISQHIAKLNADAKNIKLKADVDLSKLELTGTELDKLKVKAKALEEQLKIANQKQNISQQVLALNKDKYGDDSAITRKAETINLYRQKDVAKLQNELKLVNAEIDKVSPKAQTAFSKVSSGAKGAASSVTNLTGGISAFNAKFAGVLAVVGTGAGLFSLTEGAMKSGETLYQLTTRLRTTTAEASALNKVFSLSGVDANSLPSFLTRLDKSYKNTGKSGEEFRQKLANYGITLTDSNGKLLSTTEQLQQLAVGFEDARKSGDEEAFSMDVLGAKGQQLIPVLNQFNEKLKMAKNTKSTGLLDPKQAHDAYMQYQQLQMQIGQLKGALGASLLPIADEILPDLTDATGELIDVIKNNKDGIKDAIKGWADVLGTVGSAALTATEAVGKLANAVTDSDIAKSLRADEKILEEARQNQQIERGRAYAKTAGLIIGGIGGGVLSGGIGAGVGALVGQEIAADAYTQIGKAVTPFKTWDYAKQKLELQEQEKKALEEFTKSQNDNTDSTNKNSQAQKENAETLKLREEATKALKDEILELTTSDYDKQINSLQEKIKDAKDKGVSDETIAEYYNAKMKNITDSMNDSVFKPISQAFKSDLQNALDEVDAQAKKYKQTAGSSLSDDKLNSWISQRKSQITADWDKQVAEQIDSIWKSEYDNQLARIEREKQAWIKKGLDEVKATQWAEQQKKNLVNDNIKNMFTSQKKYLDVYRKAMNGQIDGGGYFYDFTQSNENRQQNAVKALQAFMMKEAGVSPYESTNLAEVQGFQQALKQANNWGLSLLNDGSTGFDTTEITSVLNENNAQITDYLSQINNEVPSINSSLASILDVVQQQQQEQPQQINVSPNINVNLGGAYVFDNQMKKELTDDISNNVSNAVTEAVRDATNRINTGYGY